MDREMLMGIHRKAISCASGDESSLADTVRDNGTLDFIITRAESLPTPLERASAYLWCIANWHPFAEGNKRTAWLAAQASLDGRMIPCDDAEGFDRMIRSIATGEYSEEDIPGLFGHLLVACSGDPVEYVIRTQIELLRKLSE